jgi:hypothetical protein
MGVELEQAWVGQEGSDIERHKLIACAGGTGVDL